jgi:hypothetical protein
MIDFLVLSHLDRTKRAKPVGKPLPRDGGRREVLRHAMHCSCASGADTRPNNETAAGAATRSITVDAGLVRHGSRSPWAVRVLRLRFFDPRCPGHGPSSFCCGTSHRRVLACIFFMIRKKRSDCYITNINHNNCRWIDATYTALHDPDGIWQSSYDSAQNQCVS